MQQIFPWQPQPQPQLPLAGGWGHSHRRLVHWLEKETAAEGIFFLPNVRFFVDFRRGDFFVDASTRARLSVSVADLLRRRLQSSASCADFLDEAEAVLTSHLAAVDNSSNSNSSVFERGALMSPSSSSLVQIHKVMTEIEEIGWGQIASISPDFSALTLAGGATVRLATWEATMPFAAETTEVLRFVPEPGREDRPSFLRQIAKRQFELQEQMTALHSEVRTLGMNPATDLRGGCLRIPLPSDSFRNASLVVTLDWRAPRAIPSQMNVLGPAEIAATVRATMNKNLLAGCWVSSRSLAENLQALLGIDRWLVSREPVSATLASTNPGALASSSSRETHENAQECGICYGPPDDDHTNNGLGGLDLFCSNHQQCARAFHRSCLIEALRSSAGARQALDALHGQCPYCGTTLTVVLLQQQQQQ